MSPAENHFYKFIAAWSYDLMDDIRKRAIGWCCQYVFVDEINRYTHEKQFFFVLSYEEFLNNFPFSEMVFEIDTQNYFELACIFSL